MKMYRVMVREVHVQQVDIEADNEKDAIEGVQMGEGEMQDNRLEYSHTLDPELWTVEVDS